MPLDALAVVRLAHLIAALLMSAPLYMLIIVNERSRFAVPPGHNPDRFMENIIKNQPKRCYVYLATILVTGFLILDPWTGGFVDRLLDWAILVKVGVLVLLAGLLSYVHFAIQPQIESLLLDYTQDNLVPEERRPALARLRGRRKRLSSVCLFLVLTAFIMGVRAFLRYNVWLVLLLLVVAALFAWRVYRKPLPYGWV